MIWNDGASGAGGIQHTISRMFETKQVLRDFDIMSRATAGETFTPPLTISHAKDIWIPSARRRSPRPKRVFVIGSRVAFLSLFPHRATCFPLTIAAIPNAPAPSIAHRGGIAPPQPKNDVTPPTTPQPSRTGRQLNHHFQQLKLVPELTGCPCP